MTSNVIDQLEEQIGAPSLGSEVSDEIIAILRGDPDAKKHWEHVLLGDIAEIKGGKRLAKGDELQDTPTEHPYIRVRDIENNEISKTGLLFISEEVHQKVSRYIVNKGDVIISIVGSIGFIALTPEELDGANLTENCARIVPSERIDSRYLYYLLCSREMQEQIATKNVGSTQPKLPLYNIRSLEVNLPPLHIQKQIADLLSVFDEKIELLHAQNKTIESIAQAIYKRWFVDFEFPMSEEDAKALDEPELAGQPYKSSGGLMKPSELGDIPVAFSVGSFSSFIDSLIPGEWGKEFPDEDSSERVICLRGTDLQDIKYSAQLRAPTRYVKGAKLSRCQVLAGDLVVEVSGGTEGQSTGRIAYINEDFTGRIGGNLVVSNFCKLIRPKETSRYPFIYHSWQYLYDRGLFFNFENGTTGIKNLNLKAFIETPLIAIDQERFTEFSVMAALQLRRIQENLEVMNSNIRIRELLTKKLI